MEEPDKGFLASDERSQKTAAALRALREGLGSKLETHRRRISDMEADLASHVLEVAEELALDEPAVTPVAPRVEDDLQKMRGMLAERESIIVKLQRQLSDAELHQLRLSAELTDSRSAMGAAKSKDCANCDTLRQQLASAQEDIAGFEARIDELHTTLSNTEQAITELRDGESTESIRLEAELAAKQTQLEVSAECAVQLESRIESLTQELTHLQEAEQKLRDQHNADNAAQIKAQLTIAQAQQELAERKAELTASNERESQATGRVEELLGQVESLTAELAESRDAQTHLVAQSTAHDASLSESQLVVGELQQRLNEQATELAAVLDRESAAKIQIDDLQGQIITLTLELERVQEAETRFRTLESESNSTQGELQLALDNVRQTLDDRTSELEEATNREAQAQANFVDLQHDLVEAQQSLKDCAIQLEDVTQRELQAQLRIEELVSESQTLSERESAVNSRIDMLMVQVESLTADLTAAREIESKLLAQHSANDAALAESLDTAADTQERLQESKEQLAAFADREAQANARLDELATQIKSLTEELAAARAAETELREQLSSEDAALAEAQVTAGEIEQSLKAEIADLAVEREALADELAQALQQAEEQLEKATQSAEEELSQAQKKFELALADAQKLKRENAELQEELSRRPEVAETESPELVSLRVERDALAARITELEAAPVAAVDEDSEERFADLQRRFELAVEDLRHLKQENAQLQDRLAQGQKSGGQASAANQAMDWQAQKARLLAALESEEAEEAPSAERQQQLVTIEGTISITDRVVADKDREIAELREQLSVQPKEIIEKPLTAELLDKDEIIAAERAKLEALQKEWHEKLRGAELEMSVQRATLARKEAEVEQKLQAVQDAQADPATGADGKPRRRWLSALGLRDDEEGKK
jgi:chromosome segregation ATPase